MVSALVIGTHLDKPDRVTINEENLKKKYKFIKGFFQVSCKPKKSVNIPGLVEKLLELSESEKAFNTLVPESYILLESKIQSISQRNPYISWDEYAKITRDCGNVTNLSL
jgi:hypothetical protein